MLRECALRLGIPVPWHLRRPCARPLPIDTVHPWPARIRARRDPNVTLATADLGDTAHRLLGTEPIRSSGVCADADFVLSANLHFHLPIDRFGSRGVAAHPDLGATIVEADRHRRSIQ